MANNPLIEIKPGEGLESGLFPSVEPSAGAIWRMGKNVWFRPLGIVSALGGTEEFPFVGRPSRGITQAYADGEQRLYYEDFGTILKWTGSGSPREIIDQLAVEGQYDLEPFGTWLLATDNVSNVKLWKNDENGFIDIGTDQFARGKIIKRLANRVLVYSTDVLPAGFHFSKVSDPEDWTPSPQTGAGNLPMRDLDSEIVAVADIGAAHAVYTEDRMTIVQYIGSSLLFGTPNQALTGIGAASKDAIISLRDRNYGIFRNGVFITDGADYKILDEPAVREYLQEMVDWARSAEICGYQDKRMGLLCWTLPLLVGGSTVLTMTGDHKFSFMSNAFSIAAKQDIFDNAFIAKSSGMFAQSLTSTVETPFELASQLFDAGDRNRYKVWDYALFEGRPSGQIRFGFADLPDMAQVTWYPWQSFENIVPFEPRESVYLAFEIVSDDEVKITGIKIFGGMGGLVA